MSPPAAVLAALGVGPGDVLLDADGTDPRTWPASIARDRVTHLHVSRLEQLLDVPQEVLDAHDLTTLRAVLHPSEGCSPATKRAALRRFGPIVHGYHPKGAAGGEFLIGPAEWTAHPGSIGRPLNGVPHVVGEDGRELPLGEVGQLRIEEPADSLGDAPVDAHGWRIVAGLGHLDGDGFAHLSDRRTDVVVSRGVAVTPREVEDALGMHPAVGDVAVIGVPHPVDGEQVRAIVQPAPGWTPGPELEAELHAHAARYLPESKRPHRIDFVADLPRLPTGKILRRVVRDRYTDS